MTHRLLAAGALALSAAACAPNSSPEVASAADRASRQCFFPSTVSGFREAGDRAVNLRARGDVYRLELLAACPDLRSAEKVLLDSRAGGSSVCTGLDVTMIVPTSTGPRRCPGRSLRKLAAAETATLPSAQRP